MNRNLLAHDSGGWEAKGRGAGIWCLVKAFLLHHKVEGIAWWEGGRRGLNSPFYNKLTLDITNPLRQTILFTPPSWPYTSHEAPAPNAVALVIKFPTLELWGRSNHRAPFWKNYSQTLMAGFLLLHPSLSVHLNCLRFSNIEVLFYYSDSSSNWNRACCLVPRPAICPRTQL